jgi:hypothetical protein
MSNSVAFHDQTLNITLPVKPETVFTCECGWTGCASELVIFTGFSVCPDCYNFDVRVLNSEKENV